MLQVENLSKYFSGIPAVEDVSFRIRRGEILGYLGPNGSGKSTTVKMLTGLLEPSSGHILWDGLDVRSEPDAFKHRIGYVPEEPQLYSYLSGREYLLLTGRLRRLAQPALDRRIEQLLDLFGLSDARHMALASYSKGMRQKILLAAALLHDPEILILDEPFSGLDVSAARVLKVLLKQLAAAGKVVFYSSHVLEVVEKVCDRVIILHKARVVADDSVSRLRELMTLPDLDHIFAQLVEEEDADARARSILEAIRQ